jgi:hypothetical protein
MMWIIYDTVDDWKKNKESGEKKWNLPQEKNREK